MSSNDYWLAYRALTDPEMPKGFEILPAPKPDQKMIKPGILPGGFGHPDMYIAWHHGRIEGDLVHLVTYTESKVTQKRSQALLRLAYEFAVEDRVRRQTDA